MQIIVIVAKATTTTRTYMKALEITESYIGKMRIISSEYATPMFAIKGTLTDEDVNIICDTLKQELQEDFLILCINFNTQEENLASLPDEIFTNELHYIKNHE